MKYKKLSLVVILLGLLCPPNTNARSKPRPIKPWQTRPPEAKTRSNTVEFVLSYDFSVPGETHRIRFVVLLPRTIPRRQKIFAIKFSPEPLRFFTKNGNDYAEFVFVRPGKRFKVKMNVKARWFRYDLSTARREQKKEPLKTAHLEDFLREEKFIDKNHPLIRQIAENIKGPTETDIIRSVYDYVINNMEYGGSRQKDLGAVKAVQQRKGDCSEYSDLFVALCRAKHIPARTVEGYVTQSSSTAKHVWTEVYLHEYGWVPFDPTLADKRNPWIRRYTFDTLKPVYIYFTHIRNDTVLDNYHLYLASYRGDKIKVKDSIEFR